MPALCVGRGYREPQYHHPDAGGGATRFTQALTQARHDWPIQVQKEAIFHGLVSRGRFVSLQLPRNRTAGDLFRDVG